MHALALLVPAAAVDALSDLLADEPAEELSFSMAPEPLTLRLRRRAEAR